jgi:hypothetical protein
MPAHKCQTPGGQLLLVLPQRDLVAVALCWNVSGARVKGLHGALLDALLRACE